MNSLDKLKKAFVEAVLEGVTKNHKLTEDVDYNSMSEEEQIEAVREDPSRIKFINNPSEEVQLAAVKNNAWVIQNITHPSETVQLAVVKSYGPAILRYIRNPSEEVQRAAGCKIIH